jgi:hypothetical protein
VNGPIDRGFLGRGAFGGHAVWALANDDTHDLADQARTAMAWNMIDAASPSTRDVVDALRAGRTYRLAHQRHHFRVQTVLAGIEFSDGTLLVVRRRTVDVQLRRSGRDHPQDSEER